MPDETQRARGTVRTRPRRRLATVALSALVALASAVVLALPGAAAGQEEEPAPSRPSGNPFEGTGVWIWQVPKSSGGSAAAIADRARKNGVRFVVVKAAHGAGYWGQFSPQFVSALKARGLRVCGYQRMLGSNPAGEARQAIRAVRAGADCFVIDAESEYKNKHAKARTYVKALRAGIGPNFPVGFTSFPYVSFHRTVPYSVFLGPGGAQYNLPQVYWKAIGDPPGAALARTYRENRGFGRPIYPIGQAYDRPPVGQIQSFKAAARRHGARGVSWWSWQSAGEAQFKALGR